tara:strand:- start:1240 stop:1914 length:675 start_codon:yes stop_codon:yes gene_type:complete
MKDLTLVIPAKNEPESLPYVLMELEKLDLNFIIVLEKKDYITINAIEKFRSKIIFQENNGYGDAIILGIKNVKTKYFSIFNADGSFDPYELRAMYDKIKNNSLDLLLASRYKGNSSSEDDTAITYIGNKIFTIIGKIFFKLPISDILYTYVVGNTHKILNLNLKQKDFTLCVELPIKAKRNGLNIADISANEKSRIGGVKKVNALKDGFLILLYMVKLFFNNER